MGSELHFLNVKEGDCTWIKHADGKNTIIDVFNASVEKEETETAAKALLEYLVASEVRAKGVNGNFRQKEHPVNPIEYLQQFNVYSIFGSPYKTVRVNNFNKLHIIYFGST